MATEASLRAGRWVQNPYSGKCRIIHVISSQSWSNSLPELEILKRGVIHFHRGAHG